MPGSSCESPAQDPATPAHDIWVHPESKRAFCRCGRSFGYADLAAKAIFAHGITFGYELGTSDALQLPTPAGR